MRLSRRILRPVVTGIIVATGIFFMARELPPAATVSNLLSAMINVCGIAVGFLVTAKSILLSLSSSEVMKQLRSGGYHVSIEREMDWAIWLSFAVVVLSVAAMCFDYSRPVAPPGSAPASGYPPIGPRVLFATWVGVSVASGVACCRVLCTFNKLVRVASAGRS